MVDAIVSFAVDKLGNFLIEEIGLPEKVRKDIEWLKTEFVFMQSFLNDVAGQHKSDNRANALVSEVEAIAKEAVDILDKFVLERSKWGCIQMCGCIGRKEASLPGISEKIVTLKARVEEIRPRRERYGINNISDEGTSSNLKVSKSMIRRKRRSSPYFEEDELFVGFQDVLGTLLDHLLKLEPRRSIVSIYGMGGLGKTTLARKLYNNNKVIREFPNRAWLCVSQEFNTLDLLRTIYKSFKNRCTKEDLEKLGMMDEEDLERFLRDYLEDKKYLVVFDDVWDKEAWASIRRAFPDCKNGSRVIITTRNKYVAERIDDRTYAHSLRFLTTTESWDLFCKKISLREGDANWCSSHMLNLGRSMVNKCGGLPLAIMTLGGLLLHKRHVEEWIKVKKDLWGNLKNDSIEIGFILSLSYDNLSKELQQCFLYLGLFPEDYMIDSERLMWLWMAEDFFPHCDGNEDDRADEFLEELIGRSLIQVVQYYRGIVGGCKIHDLVRDLAIEKGKKVNLLNIYNPVKQKKSLSPRYAIHAHVEKFISHEFFHSRIQSIVVFDQDSIDTDMIVSKFAMFKELEVLDLEGIMNLYELPDSIGNLVNLKYLGLPDQVRSLYPSIGNLLSLQTLRTSDPMPCTFPREISKLINLRHLFARPEYPFQFNTLTSLRTLRYITYLQLINNDVSNLKNLRELSIDDINIESSKDDSLDKISQFPNLQILSLQSHRDTQTSIPLEPLYLCPNLLKLRLGGNIESVSSLENLPSSITMLTLSLEGLQGDPMPILGRLPNLTNLMLIEVFGDVKEVTCEPYGFPQLEFLYIYGGNELQSLRLGKGSMPVIRGLDIKDCPKLRLRKRLRSIPPPKDFLNEDSFMFFDCRPYLSY